MSGGPAHIFFQSLSRCAGVIFFCAWFSIAIGAPFASTPTNIICRPDLASQHRRHLESKLLQITGWGDLNFDEVGRLRIGGEARGGSQTARELLTAAGQARDLLVLEDASRRADVVFARVAVGRWRDGAERKPPVHIVLIDFADFSHLHGDRAARDAFDVGWAVLHEVAHVVHNFDDPARLNEPGECEGFINVMRRECDLAERAEYFHTPVPGLERSEHQSRFVRLAFEQRIAASRRRKRYWLLWDANLVGGLNDQHQCANTKMKPR